MCTKATGFLLRDNQAKRLVEETPKILLGNKPKHIKVYNQILDLAFLDGFFWGKLPSRKLYH